MTRINVSAAVALVLVAGAACTVAQADTIADWDFGTLAVTAPDNTPAATGGVAAGAAATSATSLGMTNTYTDGTKTGAVTLDDVTNDGATATQTGSTLGNGNVWRIRGQNPGNGWNTAAPQYSQGTEFDVSTVGFTGIGLSFNWAATAQGVQNLQVQYNTNVNNASGWTNVGPLLVDHGRQQFHRRALVSGFGFATDTVDARASPRSTTTPTSVCAWSRPTTPTWRVAPSTPRPIPP